MQARLTRPNLIAALLLVISILSLTPTFAQADQQASHPVTIDAGGQASPMGNGPSGLANLRLNATAYKNSNQWLIIQNITGNLHIGSTFYPITGGQGSANQFGEVTLFADTDTGKAQLILHGTLTGNTLSFTSPESQLVALAYLSLNGTIAQQGEATSPTVSVLAPLANNTASTAIATNQTQGHNSTQNSGSEALPQNITETNSSAMTSTYTTNSTQQSPSTINNATAPASNGNESAPSSPQSSGNVTVTVTQYVNSTISTTQTVANTTVSYTVTTTVTNTNVTQANMTTTVTGTTGT